MIAAEFARAMMSVDWFWINSLLLVDLGTKIFPIRLSPHGCRVKSTRRLSDPANASSSPWHRGVSISGNAVADMVYPKRCVWCHIDMASGSDKEHGNHSALCQDCRRRLAPPVSGWCLRCGAPLEGIAAEADECEHCAGEAFPWERVVALGRYRGDLSRAIVRCKTPRNEPLALALGRLLFERRGADLQESKPEIVAPLPMHWLRRLRRRVNGPDLLAEALAAQLKLPLKTGVLKRRRLTPLQVDVLPAQRHIHQRKSFRVCAGRQIQDRRVLLVDDVLTTGATAAEAAHTLLTAGAAAVTVAAIARGIGDDAL
ncbi:MAG TPA: double zinc ribbon domain-containing protein [Pirellulales bacterium]|nr:double zinc ribbon domain-containing protein [Pirellulales bacterium]